MRVTIGNASYAIAIVKLSFDLAPGVLALRGAGAGSPQPLRPIEEAPLPWEAPTAPSDLAPWLPSSAVIARAVATQLGRVPRTTRAVALTVSRARSALLMKVLHVYGDRLASAPAQIAPFVEMPIVWERALADAECNPAGIAPSSGRLPNIVDPHRLQTPGGYGPISRAWPVRKRCLGDVSASNADGVEPVLPARFDDEYYHPAPFDQRCPKLEGDEWIALDGMHAELERIE